MIKAEDLVKIGQIKKPHGVKGEMNFEFTNDSFDSEEEVFLVFDLDGIFVPFRLEDYRFKSTSVALIQLKTIDSDEKARQLTHKDVFLPKRFLSEEDSASNLYTWDHFIGFTLLDTEGNPIGTITDVDDSTINTLFIVERDNDTVFIPAAEDFIQAIAEDLRQITMNLPEGLLDLE